MEAMREGIDSNGLTALQAEWGGTHDALLGLFAWLHSIPQYSLQKYFREGGIRVHIQEGRAVKVKEKDWGNVTVFHKIRNLRSDRKDVKLVGFYGMERLLEMNYNYTFQDRSLSQYNVFEFALGKRAAEDLELISGKLFNSSIFFSSSRKSFRVFTSHDCPMKEATVRSLKTE